ncbi:unnamed protein product [Ilex paraguariensis]|uniref:Uncharacterized protein n=1 Tax=Ilex paraguariensis TaxID=185542 RepID=A0ABC8RGH9_9AQUA
MQSEGTEVMRKRKKTAVEENELVVADEAFVGIAGEETETNAVGSEQMDLDITHILEKIERFTQLVDVLNDVPYAIEHGKSLLKELSIEFEERMILIHKEQMEKWQDDIKELRLLDASNEEINALLHNARFLLQHVHSDT